MNVRACAWWFMNHLQYLTNMKMQKPKLGQLHSPYEPSFRWRRATSSDVEKFLRYLLNPQQILMLANTHYQFIPLNHWICSIVQFILIVRHIGVPLSIISITGWWLGHPSEKYDFVNWDDEIPNISGKMPKMATKPAARLILGLILAYSWWLKPRSLISGDLVKKTMGVATWIYAILLIACGLDLTSYMIYIYIYGRTWGRLFFPHLLGEGCKILRQLPLLLLFSSFSSLPSAGPSTPSVRCRTSTTTIHAQCSLPDLNHDHPPPVFAAAPQPQPATPSVRCRTSTTTSHAQCSLPDLNHDHPRPVFAAGPQPRPSTPSVRCRTSTAGENAKRYTS